MPPFRSVYAAALLLALPLAACGKGDKDADLNALDAQLTNNAIDPGLQEALDGKIRVDPKYADQSGQPASANAPKLSGEAAKAFAESVKLAGGKLLATPAAVEGPGKENPAMLAAMAKDQDKPGGNIFCRKQLAYGMQWASRMPDPFGVYPGAQLKEAAGADKNGCTLRAATFVTRVPRQNVMDYYYTQARRSGFDAEHRIMGGDHVLGGTRKDDGAAYVMIFTAAPGGRTNVDIIADKGQ